MRLRKKPFKPKSLPVTPVLAVAHSEMPEAWLPFLAERNSHEGSERVA